MKAGKYGKASEITTISVSTCRAAATGGGSHTPPQASSPGCMLFSRRQIDASFTRG